jgi:hypothetical protein
MIKITYTVSPTYGQIEFVKRCRDLMRLYSENGCKPEGVNDWPTTRTLISDECNKMTKWIRENERRYLNVDSRVA